MSPSITFSPMPLSAASVLHATSLTLLFILGATANGGMSPPTAANATAMTPGDDDTERYLCYLCAGRDPMLMKYCPIYWDECHLVCFAPGGAATSAAAPAALTSPGPADASAAYGDECYVMKLYWNGSYAIVDHLDCSGVARCLLSCGGGDLVDRKALGTATTTVPAATALHGVLPAPLDFQRCGTQVTGQAAPSTVPGDGVSSARVDGRFRACASACGTPD